MVSVVLASAGGVVPLSIWVLIGRVLLAALLGGLVGFEREFREQPAGFRTHILVSVGAALFTLAGAYGVPSFAGSAVSFDPTRIAAQVVTGIGFLGAGAIIRHGATIRGLTTAAALWVTAAIGVAAGLGYYWGAGVTTVLTVLALFGLKQMETTLVPRLKGGRSDLSLTVGPEVRIGDLASVADKHETRIAGMTIASMPDGTRELVLTLSPSSKGDANSLAFEMGALEGVRKVTWE